MPLFRDTTSWQMKVETAKPNPKTCWNSPADWLMSGRGSTLLENRKGRL
jgi:hypothetical protein